MKKQLQVQGNTRTSKRLIIFGLFFLAGAITLSGIFFSIYSWVNDISVKVMNSNVPGIVLGLLVIYFGIRSILSVRKLRLQLYKDDARFSWSNFKRQKRVKKQVSKKGLLQH
ncbi:MAG TPA: hypothetical protein VHT34_02510 [Clostridia bacterium]|nr:hypothetical protein [Clostridia bacterium]